MNWSDFVRDNPERVKGKPQRRQPLTMGAHAKEWHHQEELMCRIADAYPAAYTMTTAIEHGVRLSPAQAAKIRRQGRKAGLPDVMCFVRQPRANPMDDWCGLAIELKVGRNDVTEAQERWLRDLQDVGWAVCVAHGVEQAWAAYREYMQDPSCFVSGI